MESSVSNDQQALAGKLSGYGPEHDPAEPRDGGRILGIGPGNACGSFRRLLALALAIPRRQQLGDATRRSFDHGTLWHLQGFERMRRNNEDMAALGAQRVFQKKSVGIEQLLLDFFRAQGARLGQ